MKLIPLFLVAFSLLATTTLAERPNLVAIVTDDQGRWGMGAYDNDEIRTPNMDRIAREGALFTNAFVATPVCSPSRATYLTGRWPTELGITDYISPAESDEGLGLDAVTWPQVLQQHGYHTGLIGKWHLGTQPQFHPTRLGFDHFMGFLGGGSKPMDPLLEVEGQDVQLNGPLPDLLVADAIEFLRRHRREPFVLCLHFRAPHLPYGPVPDVDKRPYARLDPTVPTPRGANVSQLKRWHRDYYASITSIDRNIGRLLNELDTLGLAANTLVLFTSDHGYNNGRHGINTKGNGHWIAGGVNGPKRPNMWDTSVRVPLAVRWPGVVEPGSRIDDMVSQIDMFRTVLGALSVPVPDGMTVHGIDFSPRFKGERIEARTELFGQYDLHNNGLAYLRMIRTEKYKYVHHFRARMMNELYDLQADPEEERNLLSRRHRSKWAAVGNRLQKRLTVWQESIGDPVLDDEY